MVLINSGASAGSSSGSKPARAEDAKPTQPTDPAQESKVAAIKDSELGNKAKRRLLSTKIAIH